MQEQSLFQEPNPEGHFQSTYSRVADSPMDRYPGQVGVPPGNQEARWEEGLSSYQSCARAESPVLGGSGRATLILRREVPAVRHARVLATP